MLRGFHNNGFNKIESAIFMEKLIIKFFVDKEFDKKMEAASSLDHMDVVKLNYRLRILIFISAAALPWLLLLYFFS
jgi:hypothetical protein